MVERRPICLSEIRGLNIESLGTVWETPFLLSVALSPLDNKFTSRTPTKVEKFHLRIIALSDKLQLQILMSLNC